MTLPQCSLRRRFQNAQNTVDVIIKAKPRLKFRVNPLSKQKQPFIRNCLLKKELNKIDKTEKNKIDKTEKNKIDKTERNNIDKIEKNNIDKTEKNKIDKSEKKKIDKTEKNKQATMKETNKMFPVATSRKSVSSRPKPLAKSVDVPDATWKSILQNYSVSSDSQLTKMNENTSCKSTSNESFSDKNVRRNIKSRKFKSKKEKVPVGCHCTPFLINKSMQTSLVDDYTNTPMFMNPQISSSVQTPFGESALKLFRDLRQRLLSNGDSEGSKIVSALEACFASTAIKTSSHKNATTQCSQNIDVSSPVLHSQMTLTKDATDLGLAKEAHERTLVQYKKTIKKQEQTINDLRSIMTKFVSHHETAFDEFQVHSRDATGDNKRLPPPPTQTYQGKVVDVNSFAEMQRNLNSVTVERDSLLAEVKKLHQVVLDLEVELKNAKRPRDIPNASLSKNFGVTYNLQGHHRQPRPPTRESECDSAYEERSSKDSRPISSASLRLTTEANDYEIKRNVDVNRNMISSGLRSLGSSKCDILKTVTLCKIPGTVLDDSVDHGSSDRSNCSDN